MPRSRPFDLDGAVGGETGRLENFPRARDFIEPLRGAFFMALLAQQNFRAARCSAALRP